MFIPFLRLLVTFALRAFFTARRLESNGSHETNRNSAVKLPNEGLKKKFHENFIRQDVLLAVT